jgi:hypothetical protein
MFISITYFFLVFSQVNHAWYTSNRSNYKIIQNVFLKSELCFTAELLCCSLPLQGDIATSHSAAETSVLFLFPTMQHAQRFGNHFSNKEWQEVSSACVLEASKQFNTCVHKRQLYNININIRLGQARVDGHSGNGNCFFPFPSSFFLQK